MAAQKADSMVAQKVVLKDAQMVASTDESSAEKRGSKWVALKAVKLDGCWAAVMVVHSVGATVVHWAVHLGDSRAVKMGVQRAAKSVESTAVVKDGLMAARKDVGWVACLVACLGGSWVGSMVCRMAEQRVYDSVE
jgi:uncharacterized membrane protein YeaQ/YmgE (transglycosylase-associated protein family)